MNEKWDCPFGPAGMTLLVCKRVEVVPISEISLFNNELSLILPIGSSLPPPQRGMKVPRLGGWQNVESAVALNCEKDPAHRP